MNIEDTVKNTPINLRPKIDDIPGKKPHHMTDEQYAEYLKMQEEMAQMPPPSHEPTVAELQAEVAELKAMIAKLTEV